MKKVVGIFLIALAGGAIALGLYKIFEKKQVPYSSTDQYRVPVNRVNYTPGISLNEPDFETAAAISIHAVVHVKTEFQRRSSVYDDFFDFFNYGQPFRGQNPLSAYGSGVIVSSDGYIVTNNHVVQDADNITITMNDKRVFKASLIGSDPSTDLALIKIEEQNLPYLVYGNSDDVKIGQWVLAVGNPFNLTSTVTAGIVSAKARDIHILGSKGAIESFIQTDAAVNPGNSGGALVNTKGELIGINAAIASGTGNYVGYSFAIPVNIVKKVVEDYIKFGKIQRAYLGVYYREIDDEVAKEKGLKGTQGIFVEDLVEGGAAEESGIKKGDIVVQIENSAINTESEMLEVIGQHNPGDKVSVMILRDGKEMVIPVTLQKEGGAQAVIRDDKVLIHGATFQRITAAERNRYKIEDGFKIIRLENGLLKSASIREGFIVYAIDKKQIRSSQDLKDGLTSMKGGVLIEGVYPNGLRAYYGIGL
jgi:Do/DeqQ family serine protease